MPPIRGTLQVTDTDVGDTLTARIVGTPTLTYSGGALPPGASVAALTSPSALALGRGTSNGGRTDLGLTYNPGPVDIDFLRPGETLTVRYGITVSDGLFVAPTQFLTFTIRGTEDRPIILSNLPSFDVAGVVAEDGPLSTTGRVPFTDLDRADTPAAAVNTGAAVLTTSAGLSLTPAQIEAFKAGFSITDPATGTWSYATTAASTKFLQAGDRIRIVYNVVVTDDFHRSVTQPVAIVIVGGNDAPAGLVATGGRALFIEAIDASAQDLGPTGGTLRVTDSDVGDTLTARIVGTPTLTYSGGALPPRADLTDLTDPSALALGRGTSNGGRTALAWSYDPGPVDVDFLRPGETLVVRYAVAVSDGRSETTPRFLTFTIRGTEDRPIILSNLPSFDVAGVVAEDGPLSTTGRVPFTDLDRADTPAAAVNTGAAVLTTSAGLSLTPAQIEAFKAGFSITNPATGTWSYATTAANTNFLQAGDRIRIVYNVVVTDDFHRSVTQPVAIVIVGGNDAPAGLVATGGQAPFLEAIDASAQDLAPTGGTLRVTDLDVGDTLTARVVGTPTLTYSGGALPPGADLTTLSALSSLALGSGVSNGARTSLPWAYDPGPVDVDFLRPGETLVVRYAVAVSDGRSETTPRSLTFTIRGTEDVPIILTDDPTFDVSETLVETDAPLSTTGRVPFTDLDRADTPEATVDTAAATLTTSAGLSLTPGQIAAFKAGYAITNPANGAWSYNIPSPEFLNPGDRVTIVYTVVVTDDFNRSVTQPVTIVIVGTDDGPVVDSGAATVSEEGLPGGVADPLGTSDTTNSAAETGTIGITSSGAVTVTLGDPGAVLTSGGEPVTWAGVGTDTLVGSAGATPIITVTIDDAGNFTVTLNGPVDHADPGVEGVATFDVPVNVSDGTITTPTTLAVTIEDDSPRTPPVVERVSSSNASTNLLLILDSSGSMGDPSGLTALDRMAVLKASVNELLEQYGARGDVRVRVVEFDNDGNALGSTWMSLTDAKAAVADLEADNGTNYDAGLLTAMDAFDDPGRLTGPDVENVSYFISDGQPQDNSDWPQIPGNQEQDGIQPNEQAVWEAFLTDNGIVSFSLGIPDIDDPDLLAPIAFDSAPGQQDADTPIIVTDLGQLTVILTGTIPPFNGNLALDGLLIAASAGGDGGFLQSITIDDVTYTFDPDANGGAGAITTSGPGTPDFTYDPGSQTLTVDTDPTSDDGDFSVVMTTGNFTFQAPADFTRDTFDFVASDADGDTAGSTLTLIATGDVPPIVRDDRVFTNVGGSGVDIAIPSNALLHNDEDADGDRVAVTATALAQDGSVAPAAANPIARVVFTDNDSDGGGFQYTGSTQSPAASNTGLVLVDRGQTGSTLNGTGLDEILIGRDGTNNAVNGFEGNDVLIGGTGNDTLNAGEGNDLIAGGGGNDTIVAGLGRDGMSGGVGNDTFRFASTADSAVGASDTIFDFDTLGDDRIDVSALFGPTMTYRHDLAFTAAGQVRIDDIAGAAVVVEVNTGGTLAADFEIRLASTTLASMTADDFVL